MPNGQSDHFVIKKSDLAKLVDGMGPATIVGETLSKPVTADDLLKFLADELLPNAYEGPLQSNEVYVSEQDRSWFIVALGSGQTWITVERKSALWERLKWYRREVWTRVLIDRLGVFTRKDGGPLFDLEPDRPARTDRDGWVTCPHCGIGFSIDDLEHWSGEKHLYCRGRVRLT